MSIARRGWNEKKRVAKGTKYTDISIFMNDEEETKSISFLDFLYFSSSPSTFQLSPFTENYDGGPHKGKKKKQKELLHT